MSRPEHTNPPELFYDECEAKKYNKSSRIINIQKELTARAIELLMLPQGKKSLLLDVGIGSGTFSLFPSLSPISCTHSQNIHPGISGEIAEEHGHYVIGCDISRDMLNIAKDRGLQGDLCHSDMGQGLPFRVGTFDGVISISAVQWLCYSNKKHEIPRHRLTAFFRTLYFCLKRGGRAAIQLYPETAEQLELITGVAMKCGFTGGVVVDFPNSKKAKKIYLCLIAGEPDEKYEMPVAMGTNTNQVGFESRRDGLSKKRKKRMKHGKNRGDVKGSRDWVLRKKERQRRQGRNVKRDSKYTARRRKRGF